MDWEIPVGYHFNWQIAQLVEQRTVNPSVPGSSPGLPAMQRGKRRFDSGWFFGTIV